MTDHAAPAEQVKKIADLIKSIEFGMLTTLDAEGRLHSRPMSSNKDIEFDGDVWFFTCGSAPKVHDIENKPYVNVAFSDPKSQAYVSLSGRAELVRDPETLKEHWQSSLKTWFPKGLEEPDLALIKINADQGEYWDSPASPIAHAISFAKRALTGKPAQSGENEKVDL